MKYIEISANGYVWRIDAMEIARNRANYYSERDPDTDWDTEYGYTMNDDYELQDWYSNNMDWGDIDDEYKWLVATPERISTPDDLPDGTGLDISVVKR